MSKEEIQALKEKIHELQEYLYSDLCKACGETALSLDKINQRLIQSPSPRENGW